MPAIDPVQYATAQLTPVGGPRRALEEVGRSGSTLVPVALAEPGLTVVSTDRTIATVAATAPELATVAYRTSTPQPMGSPGPQGPPGGQGEPGPQGPPGEDAYDDVPDLTLIFENGLI